MRQFTGLFGVSTLAALCLTASLTAAAENNLPKGFTSFRPDDGTGEVLIRQRKDEKSARAALDGALDALATYFDGRPRVLGAVADANDSEVQASFVASRGHKVVSGMVVVHAGARDTVVAVEYDAADAFPRSKKDLAALLEKNLPDAPAPEVKLRRTRLPDDSGAISVPEGWNVNAVNSMVDVTGPNGEEGHFGLWTPVYTRAGAAAMWQLGVDPRGIPICDYTDPESALKVVGASFMRAQGFEWRFKKRIDQADAPGFIGKAKYLVYDSEISKGGKTVTGRSLVLIDMLPTGPDQWAFYISGVGCRAEDFDRELPTLLNVWKSWKTDDQVFQKRLQAAAESMKATARIIQDANDYRQHVVDRAMDDWSEYIRGTSQVHDAQYDKLYEVPYYNLDNMLDRLNEHEGYERWNVIPLKDINNP